MHILLNHIAAFVFSNFSLVLFDNTIGITIDTVCQPQTDPFYGQCSVPLRILKVEFGRISPYNVGEEYVISAFRRELDDNCALLGCYAANSGNALSIFRDNQSVASSNVKT